MTPILEIQNLSHIYSPDTPFEHPALTNVDLTIGRGEFVGLIGHTGSGKSTLVQHMQYPEYQLFEETVYTDIAFGPKNMGLSKDEIDARVHRAAGFVGISEAELQKSPFDLSGGQKRRAAIAGVIAMEPDVLILDAPGLTPPAARAFWRISAPIRPRSTRPSSWSATRWRRSPPTSTASSSWKRGRP